MSAMTLSLQVTIRSLALRLEFYSDIFFGSTAVRAFHENSDCRR